MARLRRRLLLHALWVIPALVLLLGVWLWLRAGRDLAYMMRVLIHQESSTDDHRWKRSMAVAPSPRPSPWPPARGCDPITALDDPLRRGGALALVAIAGDGRIACEWYGNGGAADRPAMAFSISKTVTSLLLARAVDAGTIASLDDPITAHVPALAARDRRFAAITLAALVDMRSGIAFDDDTTFPWVDEDAPAVYYASDLARTVVERPRIEAAPGGFVYNDFAPNLIGLALQRASQAPLASGPMQALWTALGAEHAAAWLVDDHGFAWHESGLVITARDLARLGLLMLHDGKVGDAQVAPAAFVARSFDPAGRDPVTHFAGTALGYRNGWWIVDDDLVAMGRHGQVMLVSRAHDLVIVRMGVDGHAETNIAIVRRLQQLADALDQP